VSVVQRTLTNEYRYGKKISRQGAKTPRKNKNKISRTYREVGNADFAGAKICRSSPRRKGLKKKQEFSPQTQKMPLAELAENARF
jgi:hypothetical protein